MSYLKLGKFKPGDIVVSSITKSHISRILIIAIKRRQNGYHWYRVRTKNTKKNRSVKIDQFDRYYELTLSCLMKSL